MLPDESKISVLYSKKPVFVILGFVGHTSSLSGTPSPSKSSTHASPLVSPKEIPKVLGLVKLSCWYLISSIVNLSVDHNAIKFGENFARLVIVMGFLKVSSFSKLELFPTGRGNTGCTYSWFAFDRH